MDKITWRILLTEIHPEFVQWVVAKYGPLPDGPINTEDYARWKKEFEKETKHE